MDYFPGNYVGTGFNPKQSIVGWGSGEEQNSSVQQVQQATQLFQQQFQNLVGRAPTQDELGAFQSQALTSAINAPGDLSYGDASGIANSYISNSFGPQEAAYQQQQQTQNQQNQLQTTETDASNLVNQLNQQTQGYLTSAPAQAQIQGQLNNNGMLNSGAYSSTLAGLMAQGANQNEASVLSGVGVPALQGIQGLSSIGTQPYQQSLASGTTANSNLENLSQFGMEEQLAQMLSQSGGGNNILGMASGAAQGAGNLLQGAGAAKSATSYVCKELIKRGLICETDMDDFHAHIMPAMFRKGRAFWKYAMDGFDLVNMVNQKGLDWTTYKPILFDRVMTEPDACRAVDLYANACEQLCAAAAPWLWDGRVYRTSLFDSLKFFPKLFTYKPFLAALWKTMRLKLLGICDLRCCEVHR